MKQKGSNKKKVANSLVAMSSAAVLAVYTAGYARTRSAADRFEEQAAVRRHAGQGAGQGPPRSIAELRRMATPSAPGGVPAQAISASSNTTRDAVGNPSLTASVEPVPTIANVSGATVPGANIPGGAATPSPSTPAAPVAAAVTNQAPEPAAPAAPAAPVPVVPAGTPSWGKDGTYYGWGESRHGDIQAEVVLKGGRIISATIAECLTKYSCSVIDQLPGRVVKQQTPEVNFISTATVSSNAFFYAVLDAISKAQ